MITKEEILGLNPGYNYTDLTRVVNSPTYGKDVIDLDFYGNSELHIMNDEGSLVFLTTYEEDHELIFVEGEIKNLATVEKIFDLFQNAKEAMDWHEVAFVIGP